jgi:hypothetical protein
VKHLTRLVLFVTVVLATMATASAASAQSVELLEESSGQHCPAVFLFGSDHAYGGCQIELATVNDRTMRIEAFGSLASDCDFESKAAFDEDGHGYLYEQSLTGPSCTTPPCGTTYPTPWEVEAGEDVGHDPLEVRMCVQSATLGTVDCHFTINGGWSALHQGQFAADQAPCEAPLTFVHITMGMATEGYDIEVVHL